MTNIFDKTVQIEHALVPNHFINITAFDAIQNYMSDYENDEDVDFDELASFILFLNYNGKSPWLTESGQVRGKSHIENYLNCVRKCCNALEFGNNPQRQLMACAYRLCRM